MNQITLTQTEIIMSEKSRYLTGSCHILAYHIAKRLPPEYSLCITTAGGGHAYIISPDGKYAYDIEGKHDYQEFLDKWHYGQFDDDEIEVFPNTPEGRRDFVNASDWFFDELTEEPDEETSRETDRMIAENFSDKLLDNQ
jgi:hypothetical protein